MSIEQQIANARKRVLDGEQLSLDEQRELIAALRAGRNAAGEAGATSRTKKATAKKSISDDDLSADLDNLGL